MVAALGGCRPSSLVAPGELDASIGMPIDGAIDVPQVRAAGPAGVPPDSTVVPASDWLFDSALWSRTPGGDPCDVWVAEGAKGRFPRRRWVECSDGCWVAPAVALDSDVGASRMTTSTAYRDGELYLRIVSGSPRYRMATVTRVSDGEIIAAVQQRNRFDTCSIVGNALGSPFLFPFANAGVGMLIGHVDRVSGHIDWSRQWVPWRGVITSTFSNDSYWGMAFMDGVVRVASSFEATDLVEVDRGVLPITRSRGIHDQVFWAMPQAPSGHDVIKMYAPAVGTSLVAERKEAHLLTVSASESALVWIGTHGPRVFDGTFESAELYRSPRVGADSKFVINEGPKLPGANGLLQLENTDNYAATLSCRDADALSCRVIVVHLPSQRTWTIPNRPGSLFLDVLGLSDHELLLAENDWPSAARYLQETQRLVRLALDKLDNIEKDLP